jgi:ribosomal protein L7/L12
VPSLTVHQVEIESAKPTEYALKTQRDLKLAEIQNELNAGRKIEAIKVFRETFGSDLKTAKEAVERLAVNKKVEISRADLRENYAALQEGTSPTTSQALIQKQQPPKIVRLMTALFYLAIFLAIYYWLTN